VSVGPVAVRRVTRRLRRHAGGLLLVVTVSGAVAAHHGAVSMDEKLHDPGMAVVVQMCVAVFTSVGAAVATVAFGLWALGRWPTQTAPLPARAFALSGRRTPEPRAGPPPRPSICVWRR
jgi:hypothetical protein